jgi:hypothetical protein
MFIRRATIKSRESGEPYYTYRLVESVRTGEGVRQHTLLNLGRHSDFARSAAHFCRRDSGRHQYRLRGRFFHR